MDEKDKPNIQLITEPKLDVSSDRNYKIEYKRKIKENPITNGLISRSYFYTNPLGNCQIFTIGYCNYILTNDNYKELFLEIINKVEKRLLLIDIGTNKNWDKKIKDLFGEKSIKFRQDYVNTYGNGHNMSMYLIDVLEFKKENTPKQ